MEPTTTANNGGGRRSRNDSSSGGGVAGEISGGTNGIPDSSSTLTECIIVDPSSFLYVDNTHSTLSSPPTAPTQTKDAATIQKAANLLRSGLPVAFPTETVYGLAANATDASSVSAVFRAKGRPSDNPLIVHVSSLAMLESLLPSSHPTIPSIYTAALRAFWPGPLTILLPRGPRIPLSVTGGHGTMAIRFPSHPIARALIDACGFPLAAPSANTSGRPSPTLASHVYADLNGRIPLIIDGGPCDCGVESTVLDGLRNPPAILRPGGVTWEELKELPGLENVQVYKRDFVEAGMEAAPTTPGMKYRHYSPEAEVVLFELRSTSAATVANGDCVSGGVPSLEVARTRLRQTLDSEIHRLLSPTPPASTSSPSRIGVLRTWGDATTSIPTSATSSIEEYHLGNAATSPLDVARHLFQGLRELEDRGVDVILVEGIGEEREGLAVMNRLRKAAARVVYVDV
ncbi:hypothetical protein HK104_011435 [Borealophlyctis nickersoniae]|nr:hypothetical protein HK104_011435 [Borealophlyctis nickersoniae]